MVTLCNSCEQQESCKTAQNNNIKITACERYFQTRRETVRVKQTNADRIRGMSDEELAEWLKTIVQSMSLPIAFVGFDKKEMVEDWLAWLKKEVSE